MELADFYHFLGISSQTSLPRVLAQFKERLVERANGFCNENGDNAKTCCKASSSSYRWV